MPVATSKILRRGDHPPLRLADRRRHFHGAAAGGHTELTSTSTFACKGLARPRFAEPREGTPARDAPAPDTVMRWLGHAVRCVATQLKFLAEDCGARPTQDAAQATLLPFDRMPDRGDHNRRHRPTRFEEPPESNPTTH